MITQEDRLGAVLSKLDSIEIELRQCKRILQYVRLQDEGDAGEAGKRVEELSSVLSQVHAETGRPDAQRDTSDRAGLYPGQLDYHESDKPSVVAQKIIQIQEEEQETCPT